MTAVNNRSFQGMVTAHAIRYQVEDFLFYRTVIFGLPLFLFLTFCTLVRILFYNLEN